MGLKTYSSNKWVEDKIGVSPAMDSDKRELLLLNARNGRADDEEEDLGGNKSLCVSIAVLCFSIPALIGA